MLDVAYLPTNLRIHLSWQDPQYPKTGSTPNKSFIHHENFKVITTKVEPFNIKKGVYTQKNGQKIDQILKVCAHQSATSEQLLEEF
jgi:hypothetical protein